MPHWDRKRVDHWVNGKKHRYYVDSFGVTKTQIVPPARMTLESNDDFAVWWFFNEHNAPLYISLENFKRGGTPIPENRWPVVGKLEGDVGPGRRLLLHGDVRDDADEDTYKFDIVIRTRPNGPVTGKLDPELEIRRIGGRDRKSGAWELESEGSGGGRIEHAVVVRSTPDAGEHDIEIDTSGRRRSRSAGRVAAWTAGAMVVGALAGMASMIVTGRHDEEDWPA